MAISSNAKFSSRQTLPAGYTNPTPTAIGTPIEETYSVAINVVGTANADPTLGAAALLSAVETDFENTYGPNTLGLDATKTINVVLEVYATRDNTAASIFETGTEVYNCSVNVDYAVS